MSKCFCHLNGFEVKDKEARTAIGNLNTSVGTLQTDVETLKNSAGGSSKKLYSIGLTGTASNMNFTITTIMFSETAPTLAAFFAQAQGISSGIVLPATGYVSNSSNTVAYPIVSFVVSYLGATISYSATSNSIAYLNPGKSACSLAFVSEL